MEVPAQSRCAVIINRGSRRAEKTYEQVQSLLEARGFTIGLFRVAKKSRELEKAGREAAAGDYPIVILGGGDGTISALAKFFVNRHDVTVGVLPLGTGNALARDLDLPTDLAACCDIIAAGHSRVIDLGFARGDYFVNVLTVGTTTLIAQSLSPTAKKFLGKLAYVGALVHAYRQVQPFHAELEIDGVRHEFESLQIVIGNGRFHAGNAEITPRASIEDAKLSFYALQSGDRAKLIELATRLAAGTHTEMPEVLSGEFLVGSLRTTPTRKVTIDGEITRGNPVDFRIEASALRVFTPSPKKV